MDDMISSIADVSDSVVSAYERTYDTRRDRVDEKEDAPIGLNFISISIRSGMNLYRRVVTGLDLPLCAGQLHGPSRARNG